MSGAGPRGRFRVAMVAACPFPYPRGTPIRILRTAEALALRGHEVHVVTYHLGKDAGPLPFRVHRTPRLPTYRRLSPGPTYQKLLLVDSLLAARLRELLERHDIDVIHAHHYEGLIAALVARGRTRARPPVIYDAHTLLSSELRFYSLGFPRRAKERIGRLLDARLPRRAEHVIAVTDRIGHRLVHEFGVRPEDVTVVMNGIEGHLFDVSAEDDATGARPEAKTLVFSGNLAPYQGIDLLLRSFREIASRRADARLLVLTGSRFDPYEPLAAALGVRARVDVVQAHFTSLPRLLAGADVALNPRMVCDGVPQKVLNYMAAGKPTVSYRSSAGPLEDGVTGSLVEDGDAGAFAEAALQLLGDPERARWLGAAARERALSEFTWIRTAERIEEVYERVLAGRARPPAAGRAGEVA